MRWTFRLSMQRWPITSKNNLMRTSGYRIRIDYFRNWELIRYSKQNKAALSSGVIFSAVGVATVLAAPRWGKVGSQIGHRKTLLYGLVGGIRAVFVLNGLLLLVTAGVVKLRSYLEPSFQTSTSRPNSHNEQV